MNRLLPRLAMSMGLLLASALPAAAQEFRIDTELFVGKEREPAAETLTLFSGGLIYDFLLTKPEEITLFDPLRGRFTLLDPVRKIRSGVATQEVLEYMLALESHAVAAKDPLFSFAAKPAFTPNVEEYEENGQKLVRLTLTGKPLEYVAVARKPERPEAVRAVRSFSDWFARLNAMRGNLPPGARMELNKSLAERDLIPLEITRTIGGKVVRSRHLVTWTLSGEDRKRIERAGTYLAEFQPVSFDEYRASAGGPASQTAAKQAKR
jgi:hypothetical protein